MSAITSICINGTTYSLGGSGLTSDAKDAILDLFHKATYKDDDALDLYNALEAAFYPPAGLVSISAVYTQSGPVYTTDSLDKLKADLVVTATYDDTSTQTITSYTLSGTLTEGTSTITVSYGGKTATFTVTVTVFSTAPRIAYTNKALKEDGTMGDVTGACVTEKYRYTMPVESAKQTQYYDAEEDYFTQTHTLFKIKYYITNPNSVSFSGKKQCCWFDKTATLVGQGTETIASEYNIGDGRYNTKYPNLADGILDIEFTLTTAGASTSYAYWMTPASGFLPDGVSEGDIIFAGEDTPYYNKRNIND